MLFMVTYSFDPDFRPAAEERFKETGAQPPSGVTLKSRWHDVGGRQGFMLVDTTDGLALSKWLHDWTDLLTFETFPVVDDEGVLEILGG